MNTLTYIVNCLKDERKVSETLNSILKQREQSFQLKIIISEEDSSIKTLITEKLSHFKNKYEITEIDPTLNLAEQRNISLNNIETQSRGLTPLLIKIFAICVALFINSLYVIFSLLYVTSMKVCPS